jgi:hypothetical protein
MAFSGAAYDDCNYRQSLSESEAPGRYALMRPRFEEPCTHSRRADASSELMGLPRALGRCDENRFVPGADSYDLHCKPPVQLSAPSPVMLVEDTRVSNPPWTLRGTGINRWTPLCEDPQARHQVEPFRVPSDERRLAKDGHKACRTQPMDASSILPPRLARG